MSEITINLNAGYEKISPTNEFGLKHPPLYHQQRTYNALETNDLVINTYNTGTGKTRASLLRLFDLKNENVLFIAPTNELIHQHANDIREFVKEQDLNFYVAEVTGQKLREWDVVDDPGYRVRNPRKLHELIQNPRDYFPEMTQQRPLILVTNPDIFYLCFYTVYSPLDRANLFRHFLLDFNYIVIDEFHYYNAKQLANFLMFFILSKEFGYFESNGRKVCLLSATPDEKVIDYLDTIGLKYACISPDNEPIESNSYEKIQTLSELELTLHSGKMQNLLKDHPEWIGDPLHSGKEGAVISSSLRTINEIKQVLQTTGLREKIGLITGAVGRKERRDATKSFPLVLATPTVDIGYNFEKWTNHGRILISSVLTRSTDQNSHNELDEQVGCSVSRTTRTSASRTHLCKENFTHKCRREKLMTAESSLCSLKSRLVKIIGFITTFSPIPCLRHSIRFTNFTSKHRKNGKIELKKSLRQSDKFSQRRAIQHLTRCSKKFSGMLLMKLSSKILKRAPTMITFAINGNALHGVTADTKRG